MKIGIDYQFALHVVFLHRLSDFCAHHDHGRQVSGLRSDVPGLEFYSTFNPNDKTNSRPIASSISW